ncbi:MAG: efflux RND transporter permease subunit [Pirellulales bacterium]|nr:efflux RND transporter permease subunit [Pirellulales bacterium]
MILRLIRWAIHNRLVVFLLGLALAAVGGYSFVHVNVEAYPDPAPAIVEVISQYPGASAEEVERQVTVPLEVALAGMPGLQYTRSKSLFGLSHLRNQFKYGVDFNTAKLEVLNRLHALDLPDGVTPELAPTSPTGEIYRYFLGSVATDDGEPVYSIRDLKTIQDYVLEREFRRVPGIADVVSFGGAVKRYEIQPDPDRLKQYGITLARLEAAIAANNQNAGADYLVQPHEVLAVRGLGLLGGGKDPFTPLLSWQDPLAASRQLAIEDQRRIEEIRRIVLATTNNVPIRVADVVAASPSTDEESPHGVIVGQHTPMGHVMVSLRKDEQDPAAPRRWIDHDDVVQGVVLLRKGEQSLPALAAVHDKVDELKRPGKLPPGVSIERFDDRTNLVRLTTHTVQENLVVGLFLVTAVLLVFLNHISSALIVAINIPLALMFSFAMLYLRGKSANLLSLGAVDFGIIVDSSVIMVEAIYRSLAAGENADLPLNDRIVKACSKVESSLFFSTVIMVVALLPLFTMQGPEGQIFGPMADTYAFALGGALLLSLTLSPMLCRVFFVRLGRERDNWLVRSIQNFYMWQLRLVLDHRWIALGFFGLLVAATAVILPFMGMEFMPVLEEGNVYVRGTFPVNISLQESTDKSERAMQVMKTFDEARAVLCQVGRPDDGTDPTGFFNSEFFVPLKLSDDWPLLAENEGFLRRWLFGAKRPRTKEELVAAMSDALQRSVPGVDWNFSQMIRDNVMETLSGVKGENSIKIFGPDLDRLEDLAEQVKARLVRVPGVAEAGIFSIKGQSNLEFCIDREKCAQWGVDVQNVQDLIETAVGGKAFTEMIQGEKKFDVTLRFPESQRNNVESILDLPVEVTANRVVTPNGGPQNNAVSPTGTALPEPSYLGSVRGAIAGEATALLPRRRLRDLLTPQSETGEPDPHAPFLREGASTISREQGERLVAIKFSVRGRDLASTVAEAQRACDPLVTGAYRTDWSGEFEQMQSAISRLRIVGALSLVLIMVILYVALQSLMDTLVVMSSVVVMFIGGVGALFLSGENFNISAGVGFISILGVGIMNGLLLISGFNGNRLAGMSLREAIEACVEVRVRPLTMIPLTATLGLLPAAFSTAIGSQSQRPLAIVVVGGMLISLAMINLVPVLYSYYGHREPRAHTGISH